MDSNVKQSVCQHFMETTFNQKYRNRRDSIRSLLCVGLDPKISLLPAGYRSDISGVSEFLKDIVDATHHLAVAYKPNTAFFELLGHQGWELLETITGYIHQKADGALVIADAKRGDIGSTAEAYAGAIFERVGADAVTVNPLMGRDTLEPFTRYRDRGVIALCLTSNPGSADYLQNGNPPLYLRIAGDLEQIGTTTDNLWLVVGATNSADSIRAIRAAAPTLPFLVPGVGAQGGDMNETIKAAGNNLLINASRSIIYSSKNRADLATAAAAEAGRLVDEMRRIPGIFLYPEAESI